MNNFFLYLNGEDHLSDDCMDLTASEEERKTEDEKYNLPENVSGREAKEAIRFLKKEGVNLEVIRTTGRFVYEAKFHTKVHCHPAKLARSIRYWLLDYCLHHSKEYDITVKQDKVISYSKNLPKDCDYIITIKSPS